MLLLILLGIDNELLYFIFLNRTKFLFHANIL